MNKHTLWAVLAAGVLAVGVPQQAKANLLTNDSFESGTTQQYGSGTIPGWMTYGTSGFQEEDFARTGTFSVKSWWDDSGILQDFSVTAGLSYDVSAYAYNPSSDAAIGKDGAVRIEWFDSSFAQVGSTTVGTFFGDGVDPLDAWTQISGTVVAPAGATTGRVVLGVVANANPMGGGVVGWDDVSVDLAQIPEPSSVVFLGMGMAAVAGVVLRRKRS